MAGEALPLVGRPVVDGGLPALGVGFEQVRHVGGAGVGDSGGSLGGEVVEDAAVAGFAPGDDGCADLVGPSGDLARRGLAAGECFDAPAGGSI